MYLFRGIIISNLAFFCLRFARNSIFQVFGARICIKYFWRFSRPVLLIQRPPMVQRRWCSVDCNANIEARLAALETKNEEQKIGNYSKIYIQGR